MRTLCDADQNGGRPLFVAGGATPSIGREAGANSCSHSTLSAPPWGPHAFHRGIVSGREVGVDADPLAFHIRSWILLTLVFRGAHAAIQTGTSEFVVLETAAITVEGDGFDSIPAHMMQPGLVGWQTSQQDCGVEAVFRARELIDAAHVADPVKDPQGRPAELGYADRMEAWVARLIPDAPDLLRLAARCQHLERWTVPRSSFPLNREGYHQWRRMLYTTQAERAGELLREAGVGESEIAEVTTWVSKTGLLRNPGTQALEDAACLVFLENEITDFAVQHAEYSREKFVGILRKTWRKMSPAARTLAQELELSDAVRDLLHEATAGAA